MDHVDPAAVRRRTTSRARRFPNSSSGVLMLGLEGTVRLNQLPVVIALLGIFLPTVGPRERRSGLVASSGVPPRAGYCRSFTT
jgi:hypothetical protein